MFGTTTEKFQSLLSSLGKKRTLTEENLSDATREVRLALLEADVSYSVASDFVKSVKEKAVGEKLLKSLTPKEQFTKILHDELVSLMGSKEEDLNARGNPMVILLCGLQGSGKTTQCVKLASYLRKKKIRQKPLIAACDLERPAAILQLEQLAAQEEIEVFSKKSTSAVKVAEEALLHAKQNGFDLLILDTAGRLSIDQPLMDELLGIKKATKPHEILFVASAATGQDAVKTAQNFDEKVSITGSILTMLDGSARAGAALSIGKATGKPLRYEGVGEKVGDFQPFNPESMADRILGMGDVINLVRKVEEEIDEEENKRIEKKLKKATFTYNDYLTQMGAMKKMGPLSSLLKMMPGASNMGPLDQIEDDFKSVEAMLLSMTLKERECLVELIPSRRKRIANGSGHSLDKVNWLVKSFKQFKKMSKNINRFKHKAGKEQILWQ